MNTDGGRKTFCGVRLGRGAEILNARELKKSWRAMFHGARCNTLDELNDEDLKTGNKRKRAAHKRILKNFGRQGRESFSGGAKRKILQLRRAGAKTSLS